MSNNTSTLNIAWVSDIIDTVSGIVTDTIEFYDEAGKHSQVNIYPITSYQEEFHPFKVFKPVFKIPTGTIYKGSHLYMPDFFSVVNYIREKKVNFIVSNTPACMGLVAMAAASYLKIPWLDIYHTDLDFYYKTLIKGPTRILIEVLYKKFLNTYQKKADLIFVRSELFVDVMAEKFSKEKIHILNAGVDFNVYSPEKKDRSIWGKYNIDSSKMILLFVGRISKVKDIIFILWAVKQHQWENIEVVIVGDGPEFQTYYDEYNSIENLHFLGIKQNPELSIIYASADFFIMPSSSETLGKTVLESMASGVPVFVSDKGGPSYYVDNLQSGLIFRGNDYHHFLEILTNIVNEKYDCNEMKQNALNKIKPYSIEKLFTSFITVLTNYLIHLKKD